MEPNLKINKGKNDIIAKKIGKTMYIEQSLNRLKELLCDKDHINNEFYQAVEEVLETLKEVITDEDKKNKILERIMSPEQIHKFKVVWERDNGEIEVNNGYRVQFNSTLGPYKGGLRFHPSVNEKILKFLAFEQIFKNSLTGLPMGGAKGGADIDPKTMSESEMRRFCYAFAEKINPYIGELTDIPAGDIGVGSRELGFIYGKLKQLRNRNEPGTITGKPITMSGSLARKEATGYGVVYFAINMLESYKLTDSNYFPPRDEFYLNNLVANQPLQGEKVAISGTGNVAIYAAQKVVQLGGKTIAMSDSSGTIIDQNGLDINLIKDIKENKKERISQYITYKEKTKAKYIPAEEYTAGQRPIWDIEGTTIALPCATQNELTINDARHLIKNGCKVVAEGANMPSTSAAQELFLENKDQIIYAPGKASNAGGVATSYLEMAQNASMQNWSFEKVEAKIAEIMYGIFENCNKTAAKYGSDRDLVKGANIYSFERLYIEMKNQGIVS